MLFFLIALILAVLGVGAYAYANTGAHDISLRDYHFTAVPDWLPVAVVAGVVLFIFLLYAIYSSVRIRMLRRSGGTRPVSSQRPVPPINR